MDFVVKSGPFPMLLGQKLRIHLWTCLVGSTPDARAESKQSPNATYHFSILLYTRIVRYGNLPQQDTCTGGCHVLRFDFLSLQIRFKELPDRVIVFLVSLVKPVPYGFTSAGRNLFRS